MNHLSQASFERARTFVSDQGRPVDRALFAFWFEGGPAEAVERALVDFQNSDGGFGHGLEPDLRLRASSPYVTTVALQSLRRIGAPASSPLVIGAMRYLAATFDPASCAWQRVPAEVAEAPHAVWWGGPEAPKGFEANVGAEALAYAYAYPGFFSAEQLARLETGALQALAHSGDELEMHDALCWMRLLDSPQTPEPVKAATFKALERALPKLVSFDPAAWQGYGLRPAQLAPAPSARLYPLVKPGIEADLDATLAEQAADGSWAPCWEWGQYPEAWPAARREWQSYLTTIQVKVLADHGRRMS